MLDAIVALLTSIAIFWKTCHFLREEFYKALPQYKNLDFFIFGESYAGHYVPAVSHYIWQKNQADSGRLGQESVLQGMLVDI